MFGTRDNIIEQVKIGQMSPADAEAEAARLRLQPLVSHPDRAKFDVMGEAWWTLPMAVSWIAWRGPDGPVYRGLSLPPKTEPLSLCQLEGLVWPRKRYSDDDCLRILRQVEVDLAVGADVATACRSAGISDATFYTWRKKFGGHGSLATD